MSHAIDGSLPYDLAGRLRSQEETKAWLEEKKREMEQTMTDRYRHKVRGTTYRVLYTTAKASSIIEALDHMTMVVYQCEESGQVWVRPATEFFDGRFDPVMPKEGS